MSINIPTEAAIAIGLFVAKEIKRRIEENREMTEDEIAKFIAINLVRIDSIQETIQKEIDEFGG
jgi:hypothetical protein